MDAFNSNYLVFLMAKCYCDCKTGVTTMLFYLEIPQNKTNPPGAGFALFWGNKTKVIA